MLWSSVCANTGVCGGEGRDGESDGDERKVDHRAEGLKKSERKWVGTEESLL